MVSEWFGGVQVWFGGSERVSVQERFGREWFGIGFIFGDAVAVWERFEWHQWFGRVTRDWFGDGGVVRKRE